MVVKRHGAIIIGRIVFLLMSFLSIFGIGGCSFEQHHPDAVVVVDIGSSKTTDFIDVVYRFAAQNGFSIDNHGDATAPSKGERLVFMELFRYRDDVRMNISDLRDGRRFSIGIFGGKDNGDWEEVHDQLASLLDKHWPQSSSSQ